MNFRTATFAMGTRFEFVLEGSDPARTRAAAEAAVGVVEECDARLSRFRSDSLISRVNREAGSSWVRLDPMTFELLERCARLSDDTEGGFDICVGAQMDRLRANRRGAQVGGGFELDRSTSSLRFARPGSALDLGAIGKGYALDLAAASLAEAGIERALLHGGTSSVIALGAPPGMSDGWHTALGIEFGSAVAVLDHTALSVSAVRGARRGAGENARAAHVLDPCTGEALPGDARAAVVCVSATDAEAWSTALLVLRARGKRPGDDATICISKVPDVFDCILSDPPAGWFMHSRGSRGPFRFQAAPPMAIAL